MSPTLFDVLLHKIKDKIIHPNTHKNPIGYAERLAVTLRYLATGDSQQSLAFTFRIGKTTISNIIKETCQAIWDYLSKEYLAPPTSKQWNDIAKEFNDIWNFPNCIGAIDGKHIQIQCPNNSGSLYYNYKNTFSIVLLAVCDAKYRFTLVDIGSFGRQSDGGIFSLSSLYQAFEIIIIPIPEMKILPVTEYKMPHVLVRDEAFPLKKYILRPYPGRNLSLKYKIFNYRLSRARRVIENSFGILASKWRIIRRPIISSPDLIDNIIKAIVCLHNFLLTSNAYSSDLMDKEDEYGNVHPGSWRQEENYPSTDSTRRFGSNNYSSYAFDIRERFSEYFSSSAGSLQWQNNIINRN